MRICPGDLLPTIVRGPVTRTTLALFAGGSGDHSSIHLDVAIARAAGFPDVIVHGMLSMAYMGQCLTHWVPQDCIRRWHVRFVAPTPVDATIYCGGGVADLVEEEDERWARLELSARTDRQAITLTGSALVGPMARLKAL